MHKFGQSRSQVESVAVERYVCWKSLDLVAVPGAIEVRG